MTKGKELVDEEREIQYGNPVMNMELIGYAWQSILKIPVSSEKVALCMAALKLVREAHSHKEDNLADAEGYIEIVRMIEEKINDR